MHSRKTACLVGLLTAICAGCRSAAYYDSAASIVPPRGMIFANVSAPLTVDYAGTSVASRKGEASTLYVRDPILTGIDFSWEDASIETAAEQGGITSVHYADYSVMQVLGVFGKFTVTVYGE